MRETVIGTQSIMDNGTGDPAMSVDVLAIAAGELGNRESPADSKRTKYGRWYGLDGQPWCMMFVQWCFAQAGTPLPCRTASCSQLLNWYRQFQPERVMTAAPQRGDVVIYSFGHTGILEWDNGGTVTVIEGNTSPGDTGSQDNGGGVYRRTRKKTQVAAYIRPFDRGEENDGRGSFFRCKKFRKKQSVCS